MSLGPKQFVAIQTIVSLLTIGSMFNASHAGLAENRWPDERAAGAFHCHANFQLYQFDRLWREMAKLEQDLTRQLRISPVEEPIHLFLFEDRQTYRDYLKLHFPGVPYRRALYIKERGPGMVFAHQNAEFENDVRHESTHAVLHASLPVVPLWLDEGLAEYFEVPASQRAFDSPHLSKVRWAARFGQMPKLESLEGLGELTEMGPAEYRHAWAWVHFMLHGPAEAHLELTSFLNAIQALSPPGVLSERLRQKIPDLNDRFVDHFRNWKQ
jgi:hypothetical protein